MYDELLALLKEKIDYYHENIKLVSGKILEIKYIYDMLKPKGRPFDEKNGAKIAENKEVFDKLIKVIEKNNYIVVRYMYENQINYAKYLKEIESKLNEKGLSRAIIFDDRMLNWIRKRNIEVYNNLIMMRENEQKLYELSRKNGLYICNYIINMYESLFNEKEEKKDKVKALEYAYRKILKNETLTAKDISEITLLIDSSDLNVEEVNKFFLLLNKYIENRSKVSSKEEIEKENEGKNQGVKVYTDLNDVSNAVNEDNIYDEDDGLYENYLLVLRSFNSFNDVNIFLNSIMCSKQVIQKILDKLTDSDEDELLKEYLQNYLIRISGEELKNINNEESKVTVLYYGFTDGNNKILDDISKGDISSDHYQDVLNAITLIEKNGASNKRENIVQIRKVFKLRKGKIRVTFKRLSNDLYIILGVFRKKDFQGSYVIDTTQKRNSNFLQNEKSIIEARKFPELWNELLAENALFEEEIKKTLLDKIKK